MRVAIWRMSLLSLVVALGVVVVGCGDGTRGHHAKGKGAKAQHSHEDWWCDEHGVPEAECAQCNAKLAAEFKKKGDWCKEHDRPDSQCFICHPELKEKFAQKYRDKYGKEPPPTEDDEKKEKKEGKNG
jgi:hypothetical protein